MTRCDQCNEEIKDGKVNTFYRVPLCPYCASDYMIEDDEEKYGSSF